MIIRWTPRALTDLEDIHTFIAERDATAAGKLITSITTLVATKLAAHPQMGRPGRVEGTRELVAHRNYLIAYRVSGDAIDILAVRHAARLWPEAF